MMNFGDLGPYSLELDTNFVRSTRQGMWPTNTSSQFAKLSKSGKRPGELLFWTKLFLRSLLIIVTCEYYWTRVWSDT